MRRVAERVGYSYEVTDLPYRAVSVADFRVLLGAYVSAGKYYEFGASVADGVDLLRRRYDDVMTVCGRTRWVLAGYSQGAMVVSHAVTSFAPTSVSYVGLFGDPETNLPEGRGIRPPACRGAGLSSYRVYAPNCRTDSGVLGVRQPYVANGLEGKYGLWCNRQDYICGSSGNPLRNQGHAKYSDFGFFWMSKLVSLRLPERVASRQVSQLRLTAVPQPDDVVFASLPLEEYYVEAGQPVVFDASASYSSSGQTLRFEWLTGDTWTEGTATHEAVFQDDSIMAVRVTDESGASAVARASVIIGAPPQSDMAAPRLELTRTSDGRLTAHALERPAWAKYLLVRLNGFDLGYAPAEEDLQIGDLRFTDDELLSFAWLDEDYELSDEYFVRADELPVMEEAAGVPQDNGAVVETPGEATEESEMGVDGVPKTGIAGRNWAMGLVAVIAALTILGWLGLRKHYTKKAHCGDSGRKTVGEI